MYRYSAFGLTIDSEFELAGFAEGSGDPDVVIRVGKVDGPILPATIDDEVAIPAGIGRFRVRQGREIIADPAPDAEPGVLGVLLGGRLMAYLLRQRGCLPLHASAVDIDGRAVLFLGESGTGKSTTAAAFYARGRKVLVDDVAAVSVGSNGVEVRTAWSGLRLLDDALEALQPRSVSSSMQHDKHFLSLETLPSEESRPVQCIYFLQYCADGELRTSVVGGSEAAALLNTHSFLRSWRAGNELMGLNLKLAASVAAAVPVYRLFRPHSLQALPALVAFVEKDVAGND